MTTFLQDAATYIYHKYEGHISDLCVVLPTRRASIYFKNALAQAAPSGLWSPEVSAMEDFIVRLAGVEVVEPIHLQLELYDIMQALDPRLDFDQYVTWAATLLEDFSRIDRELVDPKQLFEYLSEAKTLERWDPHQGGLKPTPLVQNYFKLWDNLQQTYHSLRQHLQRNKQAYPGMAYRLVADSVEQVLRKTNCHRFIFIGLNALSKAEEKIIRTLLHHQKAEVLFDSDDFYMQENTANKAGYFLKKYQRKWNLPEWRWQQNRLLTEAKEINAIGVANSSMQGKVAGQLLQQIREEDPQAKVAIVLPDESLLLPVLHSIGGDVTDYNVTMGLSFKGTPLFNLIDLLFEMHLTGVVQPASSGYNVLHYHHATVTKVLSHPFIRRYEQFLNEQPEEPRQHDLVGRACTKIVAENRVLLSARDLIELGQSHPLFVTLFTTWRDCDDIIESMYQLIDLLRQVYMHRRDNPIETEYLYIFYTLVRRLDTIFDCRVQKISVRSFKKFLYEQINQTRLPFSGEPISDTQVMGMLETRALDFENLIILSVNENVLPQPKKHHSLLPYDVLTTFGLPTYAEHESITSYTFYRLLQRAKRINLLYVLPSDTYGSGEKSRYILQLQHDLVPANPLIRFQDLTATVEQVQNRQYEQDIVIRKDEELLQTIRAQLAKGLYPSHLNAYVNCSLQYYFSRLAGIGESDGVKEQLGPDTFGNLVHQVMENLFRPFEASGQPVTAEAVRHMLQALPAETHSAFRQLNTGSLPEYGMNHFLLKVAEKIVEKYLKQELEADHFPLQVLHLEKQFETTLEVPVGAERLPVKIAGRADRVDLLNDTLRVIDFKTGKVEKRDLEIPVEELELRLLTDRTYDKVRQLWLYRYILAKLLHHPSIPGADESQMNVPAGGFQAGIVSFRNIEAGFLTSDLPLASAGDETPEAFIRESERLLQEFVQHLLDPDIPFRKTTDVQVCAYCIYRGICAR
jgi:ATP-dependent helicase/nuclease subunit B